MVPKEDRITTTVPEESKPTAVVSKEDRITTTTRRKHPRKIELPVRK